MFPLLPSLPDMAGQIDIPDEIALGVRLKKKKSFVNHFKKLFILGFLIEISNFTVFVCITLQAYWQRPD